MKDLVIGTAGHIDHGKSALVEAITGTHPDRFPEEKSRGMTLDIGFASREDPRGVLHFVDLPGHEKFVRNMLAGATGIDLGLLVVAADEGVMPQTREHTEILELLRVTRGVVALTKIDLVEEDMRELALLELREFLEEHSMGHLQVVPVSAATGEGVEDLVERLFRAAARLPESGESRPFRQPIDRVFTVKGFGTVVTGTCIDGMLEVGERVQILPGGLESKVRGIQVFGRQVDAVHAGRRAALNLPDVSHGDLTRGMLATLPGAMSPSRMVDVRLKVLPSAPFDLKAALRCTLHIHTQEIEARLFPSTGRAMAPGEEGVAQIRADRPVVCWPGDRFILRLPAPARTVGGGEVLLPARRKAHWSRPIDRKRLAAYGRKDPLGRWRAALAEAGPFGTNPADLSARMGLTVEKTLQVGSALSTRGDLVIRQPGDWWLDPEEAGQWDERAVSWLRRAQAAAGLIPWIPRQEFLERWKRIIGAERGDAVLRSLSEQGRVEVRGPRVRTAGHSVKLTGEQEAARKRIVSILEEGFPTPSSIKDLRREAGSGVDDVVAYMIDRGDLLRFSGDTVMLPAALVTIRERLARFASESAPLITVPEFKELFGLTRRTAMPLLEFLDDLRVTRREGDARRIL